MWNRNEDPEVSFGKFDQILIADCLFFDKFHIDLVYTLRQLAHAETEILIAAPERGQSMAQFLALADQFFSAVVGED